MKQDRPILRKNLHGNRPIVVTLTKLLTVKRCKDGNVDNRGGKRNRRSPNLRVSENTSKEKFHTSRS